MDAPQQDKKFFSALVFLHWQEKKEKDQPSLNITGVIRKEITQPKVVLNTERFSDDFRVTDRS